MLFCADSSGGIGYLNEVLEAAGKSRRLAEKCLIQFEGICNSSDERMGHLQLTGRDFLHTFLTECWHDVQDVMEFCDGYLECDVNDFEDNFEDILSRENACR